jgi:membrane protease YdiL (CAAX protease family)
MVINVVILSLSIIVIGISLIVSLVKRGTKTNYLTALGILVMVLFFFLIDTLFYFIPNIQPFLFSFYDLIGLTHSFNFILFSFLSLIVFIKIISIYVYIRLKPNVIKIGQGDTFFQYFTNDFNQRKMALLLVLFPLSALVEEMIYRSLFLSFLIYYFNFNLVFGILFASFVFAVVHYSASKDSGYMLSLVISSIIYFIALLELGLLSAWIFHLSTNLSVLLFYYQRKSKVSKIKSN